jgi:MipA family protein
VKAWLRTSLAAFTFLLAVGALGQPACEETLEGACAAEAPTDANDAPQEAPAAATVAVPAAAPIQSPWRIGVALGYGARTNPLIQSKDLPIAVDLDIAWFGERFFFDNGDLGVTVAENDALTLNIVARVNSERVFFGKTDTRLVRFGLVGRQTAGVFSTGPWSTVALEEPVELTVPNRRYAVELGFEMLMDGSWGMLQLTAHHDVGGTHEGYELFLDYGYGWRAQRWYIEPSAGLALKSAALNDYYWGVRPGEAGAALPAYRAGRGINAHARVLLSYQISRRWAFAAVAEYERLNGAAASSPIVARRDILGYFAGARYRF